MNTRWHDLIVERLKDGGIHLEQHAGLDDPSVIHLHPQQLRHVAEQFGLVAPNYPDDELSKSLAEQICRVYLDMADDYRHLSHTLESTFERLSGFIDGIPDAIFPNHLWDEREERERKQEEERQKRSAKLLEPQTDGTQESAPSPSELSSSDGQLGLLA